MSMQPLARLLAATLAFCSAAVLAAVDINQADQAALESVKGIGPALSTRLLDERKKSPFKDWPDLIDRVKGIGPGNASRYSEAGLTVNGSPYAGTAGTGGKPDAKADRPGAQTAKK